MNISVVYSPAARQMREWALELPAGSTVSQVLEDCGIWREFTDLQPGDATLGIWGKPARLIDLLQESDRVEIYRGLKVDPKVARRERFRRQGAKSAGLFASRRTGAKAGY